MAAKMRACAAWFEEHEAQRKAIEADPLYVYGAEGLVALGISSKEAERMHLVRLYLPSTDIITNYHTENLIYIYLFHFITLSTPKISSKARLHHDAVNDESSCSFSLAIMDGKWQKVSTKDPKQSQKSQVFSSADL